MEAQAALFDIHVAPDLRKQRPVWDDFTGALNQNNEKIESPTAETRGDSLPLQSAFCRKETERAECERSVPFIGHADPLKRHTRKTPPSQGAIRAAVSSRRRP
jgi:hypothetical protein